MINTIMSFILISLFLLLGHFTQAFKKLFGLITKLFLKLLSLFGIKIQLKEKHLKVDDEFKKIYKDVKTVKLSKKNIKQESSIHWVYLTLFIIAGLLVIINLNSISGNAISNWIYSIQIIKLIKTPTDMNTFFTATLFSVLSFSLSRLLTRWKETKQQRIEQKNLKIKLKAMNIMSSKELLDEARKKDKENYKELK